MDSIISRFYGSSVEERDAAAHDKIEQLVRQPVGAQMVLDAREDPALRAQMDAIHSGLEETAIETLMLEVAGHPQGAQIIWDLSQEPYTGACMEAYPSVLEAAVRTLFNEGRVLLAGKLK